MALIGVVLLALAACGGGNSDPTPQDQDLPGLWNASVFDLGIGLPETCRIEWAMFITPPENPEAGDPLLSKIPQSAIMKCDPEPDRESMLELFPLAMFQSGDTVVMYFGPFDTFAVARLSASGLSGELVEVYRGVRFSASRRSGSVDPNLELYELSLASEFSDVEVGDSMPFVARGEDGYGLQAQDLTVEWESSEPGTASIRSDGVLHGLTAGEVTITASAEGLQASKSVTVLTPAASVEITEVPDPLIASRSYVVRGVARDAGGQVLPGRRFHWTSSDPAVATVEGFGNEYGSLMTVSPGTATIAARSSTVSGSVTLTVVPE